MRMSNATTRACWAAAMLMLATFADARADTSTFGVVPDRTTVRFAVSQFGFAMQRGRFERTRGTIVLDAERSAGSIDLIVEVGSVDTGWDLRDAFLKSQAMFDVERYPEIRFRSTALAFDGGRVVAVDGEITMHGVTHPVRFDVTRFECARDPANGRAHCDAAVTGRVSRRAFGMAFAYPLIGDEVGLDFAVTASRVRDEGESRASR
jgi:polyisoprenoid-binding protein YceI